MDNDDHWVYVCGKKKIKKKRKKRENKKWKKETSEEKITMISYECRIKLKIYQQHADKETRLWIYCDERLLK